MAEKILIIDFSGTEIFGGVFASDGATPLDFCAAPFDGDVRGAVAALLGALTSKGHVEFSKAAAGLPSFAVSMRPVKVPFSNREKLDDVLPFEAGELFIKDADSLIIKGMPLSTGALAVSVEKAFLKEFIDILKQYKIDPVWVGPSIFARALLLKGRAGGTLSLIEADSVVVTKDDKPVSFMALNDASALTVAIAALKTEGVEIDVFYAGDGMRASLAAFGKPVKEMEESVAGRTGIMAIALDMRDGFHNGINFRTGEFVSTKVHEASIRGLKAAYVLFAALICVWSVYSYVKYRSLTGEIDRTKAVVESAYRGVFAGEGRISDASYQLEAKLKALKDEKGVVKAGVDVLAVLSSLASASDRQWGIRLYHAHMDASSFAAFGEAATFDGVNGFREALSKLPLFKDVTLTEVKTKAGGSVSFNISGRM